jgi:hypothetical protein
MVMLFTPEEIKKRLKGAPFTPMRIITTAGEKFDIYHPDLVMVGINNIEVGIPRNEGDQFYEFVTRVALAHITELREIPAPVQPAKSAAATD